MKRRGIPQTTKYATKEAYVNSWKGTTSLSDVIRRIIEKSEFGPGERLIIFLSMRDSERVKKLLRPVIGDDHDDYGWCVILQNVLKGNTGQRGRFSITWSRSKQFCLMFQIQPIRASPATLSGGEGQQPRPW